MDGSPSSIVMMGFGNGTYAGSPGLVTTMGFGVGEEVVPDEPSPEIIATYSIKVKRTDSYEVRVR